MKASVLTCAKWNSLTPEHLGEIASQVVQFRHASCGCFSGIHRPPCASRLWVRIPPQPCLQKEGEDSKAHLPVRPHVSGRTTHDIIKEPFKTTNQR